MKSPAAPAVAIPPRTTLSLLFPVGSVVKPAPLEGAGLYTACSSDGVSFGRPFLLPGHLLFLAVENLEAKKKKNPELF